MLKAILLIISMFIVPPAMSQDKQFNFNESDIALFEELFLGPDFKSMTRQAIVTEKNNPDQEKKFNCVMKQSEDAIKEIILPDIYQAFGSQPSIKMLNQFYATPTGIKYKRIHSIYKPSNIKEHSEMMEKEFSHEERIEITTIFSTEVTEEIQKFNQNIKEKTGQLSKLLLEKIAKECP